MTYKQPLSLETLEDRFLSLPKDVQNALTSVDFTRKVDGIGKKRGLSVDRLGILGEELTLVLLGETPSREFPATLRGALSVPEETLRGIVEDINAEVFLPLRASLASLHENGTEGEEKRENARGPRIAGEETLPTKEEILLHIENPARAAASPIAQTAVSLAPSPSQDRVPPAPETGKAEQATAASSPVTAPVLISDLVSQKLAAPFSAPAQETRNGSSLAATEKRPPDPYRETME